MPVEHVCYLPSLPSPKFNDREALTIGIVRHDFIGDRVIDESATFDPSMPNS